MYQKARISVGANPSQIKRLLRLETNQTASSSPFGCAFISSRIFRRLFLASTSCFSSPLAGAFDVPCVHLRRLRSSILLFHPFLLNPSNRVVRAFVPSTSASLQRHPSQPMTMASLRFHLLHRPNQSVRKRTTIAHFFWTFPLGKPLVAVA